MMDGIHALFVENLLTVRKKTFDRALDKLLGNNVLQKLSKKAKVVKVYVYPNVPYQINNYVY